MGQSVSQKKCTHCMLIIFTLQISLKLFAWHGSIHVKSTNFQECSASSNKTNPTFQGHTLFQNRFFVVVNGPLWIAVNKYSRFLKNCFQKTWLNVISITQNIHKTHSVGNFCFYHSLLWHCKLTNLNMTTWDLPPENEGQYFPWLWVCCSINCYKVLRQ